MQTGTKIDVRVRAVRGDGSLHRGSAVALFFAPGRDPAHDPADRSPDRQVVLAPDPAARGYAATVPTAGWASGTWTVQAVVLAPDGAAEGWSWSSVPLDP